MNKINPTMKVKMDYYPETVPVEKGALKLFNKKVQVRKLDDKDYITKKLFHAVQHGYLNILREFDSSIIKERINKLDSKNGFSLLHYACLENHVAVVEFLLDRKADINIQGSKFVTPIHVAAQKGHAYIIETLCQRKSLSIDSADAKGQTALLIGCRRGHYEVVETLLLNGADICKLENDKISVLHHPVRRNDIKMVKFLIKNGAPLNIKNNNGQTPLMIAAIEGLDEMMKMYLGEIKDGNGNTSEQLNEKDNDGFCCLSLAVQNKNSKIVKICMEYGADVYCKQNDGKTIFHTAAIMGYTDIFELVDYDENFLNLADIAVQTPLHLAVINNHLEMIKELLNHKAALNLCDKNFRTPLLAACQESATSKKASDITKFLIDNHADMSIRDENLKNVFHYLVLFENVDVLKYFLSKTPKDTLLQAIDSQDGQLNTPLHIAAKMGNVEIVKILLDNGANPILVSENDYLPLHYATKYGHLECVKVLLEKSERTSSMRNSDEITPILLAAEQGSVDIFKYLISVGKDPFAKDEFGRNSLLFAARSGSLEIVKLLLDMDINVNMPDQLKNTALHEAVIQGHTEVVKYIWEKGAKLSENVFDQTQLDMAIVNNRHDIIKFMLNDDNWKTTMAFRHKDGHGHMKKLLSDYEDITYELLDKSISENTPNKMDPNYEVKYSFEILDAGPDDPQSILKRKYALKEMAKERKESLLKHPLSEKLINLKWHKIGLPIYIIDVLLYLTYLAVLNAYIQLNSENRVSPETSNNSCNKNGTSSTERGEATTNTIVLNAIVYAITAIRLLIHLIKLAGQRQLYFLDYWNYIFLTTDILVYCFIDKPNKVPCVEQWRYAPALIFLSWFNLLYYIEFIPVIGIIVILFENVLKSVIKIFLVFACLIIGFALAFEIINDDYPPFANVGLSIVKVIGMMIGEVELVTYFIDGQKRNYYVVGVVLVSVFMLTVSIALFNLLVGVAVGDIDKTMREATVESIKLKVDFVYNVESNVPKIIQRKIYIAEKFEQLSRVK